MIENFNFIDDTYLLRVDIDYRRLCLIIGDLYLLGNCGARYTFVRGCLINPGHSLVNIRVSLVRFKSSV